MKICLECQKRIMGRSDKKFCDDACRNAYNNRKNFESNGFVKSINSVLRRNRNILHTLTPEQGPISVSEKTLQVMGFNFDYCTELKQEDTSYPSRYCYEYGYQKVEEGVFMILKQKKERSA